MCHKEKLRKTFTELFKSDLFLTNILLPFLKAKFLTTKKWKKPRRNETIEILSLKTGPIIYTEKLLSD